METYVAIKISISKTENDKISREVRVLKALAATDPSPQHVISMLDAFDLTGPNGTHECLVLELVGPSVPDMIDAYFPDGRLPGDLAKRITKQTLVGLDTLHKHNICHGGMSYTFLHF